MDWQERLNASLAWIEDHLTEEWDWPEAAAVANASVFHYLRMFEVVIGQPAGDYLRKRRLSRAAQDLAAGDERIIDLALRYGYESPDAFTRAFKRLFGCTPTEARSLGLGLQAWNPVTVSIVLKGATAMDYRIKEMPAFTLTGIGFRTRATEGQSYREIPAYWDAIMADGRWAALEASVRPESPFGVCAACAEFDAQCEDFLYLVGIEAPRDRARLPQGARDLLVPAATWGIFAARGPLPGSIQEVWKRVWTEWFPGSGWEAAPGPQLEVYSRGDNQAPDYHSEVWIPLKKAGRS